MFEIDPIKIFWIAANSFEDMERFRAYHNVIAVNIDHFYGRHNKDLVNLHPRFDFYPYDIESMSIFCDIDLQDRQLALSVEPMFRTQAFVHCLDGVDLLKTKLQLS